MTQVIGAVLELSGFVGAGSPLQQDARMLYVLAIVLALAFGALVFDWCRL